MTTVERTKRERGRERQETAERVVRRLISEYERERRDMRTPGYRAVAARLVAWIRSRGANHVQIGGTRYTLSRSDDSVIRQPVEAHRVGLEPPTRA